ncbi:MAG: methylmalonyl-CoA mutase, partial [Gammaproteobacteria bacterium]|nr:methylmalonyl-CoA mutase [Gammaproteobacteria bacterium]
VEGGERTVVGVNRYQIEEEDPELFRPDAGARDEVLQGLARVRAERDTARSKAALATLGEVARGSGNLMPPILAAVEAYATIGEICAVLEDV